MPTRCALHLVLAAAAVWTAGGRSAAYAQDDAPRPSEPSRGLPPAPSEPRYADKPVSFWIGELRSDATRPIAMQVLPTLGAAAAPALAGALADPDPNVRRAVASILAKPLGKPPADLAPFVPQLAAVLADKDASTLESALKALRRTDAAAAPAAAAIARHVDHEKSSVRLAAMRALGPLGAAATPAVPRLAARLTDKASQETALETLAELGPAAADAAPALLSLGSALQAKNRKDFANAVAAVAPLDPRTRLALVSFLADDEIGLRRAVIAALGRCAEKGSDDAVSDIAAALDAPEGPVRNAAATALRPLGERAKPFRRVLLARLDDVESSVVSDACALLQEMGAIDEDAVPDLIRAAARRRHPSVTSALHGLGDRAVAPLVACIVGGTLHAERALAAEWLAGLSRDALDRHGPALVAIVRDRAVHAETRGGLIRAIPWLVASDVGLVADLLDDADSNIGRAALEAFTASPGFEMTLARALVDPGPDRLAALRVWEAVPVPSVRPAVTALLEDPDPSVRRAAATALLGRDERRSATSRRSRALDPLSEDEELALGAVVVECLTDPDESTRRWAVLSAPRLRGEAAGPAVPLLLAYVLRPASGLSRQAAGALGTIAGLGQPRPASTPRVPGEFVPDRNMVLAPAQPARPAALAALRSALVHEDRLVRAAAVIGLFFSTDQPGELPGPCADVLAKCDDAETVALLLAFVSRRPEVGTSSAVVSAVALRADDPDDGIGRLAVQALVAMSEQSEDAWRAFMRLWDQEGHRGRRFVPGLATAAGSRAARILLAALEDPDRTVRIAALKGATEKPFAPNEIVRTKLESIGAGDDQEAAKLAGMALDLQKGVQRER